MVELVHSTAEVATHCREKRRALCEYIVKTKWPGEVGQGDCTRGTTFQCIMIYKK